MTGFVGELDIQSLDFHYEAHALAEAYKYKDDDHDLILKLVSLQKRLAALSTIVSEAIFDVTCGCDTELSGYKSALGMRDEKLASLSQKLHETNTQYDKLQANYTREIVELNDELKSAKAQRDEFEEMFDNMKAFYEPKSE